MDPLGKMQILRLSLINVFIVYKGYFMYVERHYALLFGVF